MKTTEEMIEMIEVIEAFKEGKKIERRRINDYEWVDDPTPLWDWALYDYRKKPEKEFRPYKDTEEMLNDFCERFPVKRTDYGEPFIWIKNESGVKYLITAITECHVWIGDIAIGMTDLFKKFTYKDVSPCGKKA